jgi:hypothetical protein
MRFRFRKSKQLGPLRLNFTEHGFSSWGLHIGPWSWNSRTRRQTFDTPGPGYVEFGGRTYSRGGRR